MKPDGVGEGEGLGEGEGEGLGVGVDGAGGVPWVGFLISTDPKKKVVCPFSWPITRLPSPS